MCVGKGSNLCTPVLTNMCNMTLQVLRLSTFVFNKCWEKKIFTIIFVIKSLNGFGLNNVGSASQTVAQHYINIGLMYHVIWCFGRRDVKVSPVLSSSQKTRYSHPMLFQWWASVEVCGSTLKQHWLNVTCLRKVYNRPGDILVFGQRRRQLTGIEPAMGCNARWVDLHPLYEVFRRQILNECWPAPAMVVKGIHIKDIFELVF